LEAGEENHLKERKGREVSRRPQGWEEVDNHTSKIQKEKGTGRVES